MMVRPVQSNPYDAVFKSESGRVREDLLQTLSDNGFWRPIRSFADARMHHPELLLVEGWDRTCDGVSTTYRREGEGSTPCEQVVVFGPEGRKRLVTRAGDERQILQWTPGRGVEEIHER